MLTAIAFSVIVFQATIIVWLFFQLQNNKGGAGKTKIRSTNTPQSVANFYNQTTDKFLAVYGEVIQAFRTNNVEDYLDYTAQSMQLSSGMKVIDAGCGVCGPACHFANQIHDLYIEAITVSSVQCEKSKANIEVRNLHNQVHVQVADYHRLNEVFAKNAFDRVYFLESFGHSNSKEQLIKVF